MGIVINGGLNYLLTNYHSYHEFEGKSILMLGVQMTSLTYEDFYSIAEKLQFEIAEVDFDKYLALEISSYELFHLIGFKKVIALDLSPYEGADIVFDLQNEILPSELIEQFDFIYDGGTLEHVFDVSKAMDNISKMLKITGVVIHDVPTANWVNHGFYSFSPSLFIDYYKKYSFKMLKIYLLIYGRGNNLDIYSPDCRLIDCNSFLQDNFNKMLGESTESKGCALTVCIARKEKKFEKEILTQNMYEMMYKDYIKLKKETIHRFYKEIKKELEYGKQIVIYGCGSTCENIIAYLEHNSMDKKGLIGVWCSKDGDEEVVEKKYGLRPIFTEEIQKEKVDTVIIASLSHNVGLLYKRIKYIERSGINILKFGDAKED